VHPVGLRDSQFWYDLAVACDQDSTFLRRLAGHVETGRPSTSDPALAPR
jgi:phospholipase C